MAADVVIFANPIAGSGRGKVIAERIAIRLARDGFHPRTIFQRPADVGDEQIPRQPLATIAIGGDGTIRGAAARMLRTSNAPPPLLVIPMGTANLLGRHLHLNWSQKSIAQQVSAALGARNLIHFDAATANGELFLLMTGVGLDATVVHELEKVRSGPIDYTSYVLPAALALRMYRYPSLTVTVDGNVIADQMPSVAFVGNVKEYGAGFPILPLARPDDGELDVCVLPVSNVRDLVNYLMYAVAGEHLKVEGTLYVKGKHILIESTEQVPVQVDGDAAGHTPVTIDLLPVRLPFIVPPETSV